MSKENLKALESVDEDSGDEAAEAANLADSEAEKTLAGRGPLPTILILSIGPLCSQISNTMFGLVSTLWLGRAVSELATTALSTASTIDAMPIGFGFFFMISAVAEIPALFGRKESKLVPQLVADLIRVSLLAGIFLPAVLLPCAKPLMRWFGAEEDVVSLGFAYLVPLLGGSFVACVYLLLCGVLQAMGRTFLFGACQITVMILNAAVFNPLFLLVLKIGVAGSSWSIVCSQLTVSLGLITAFYCGKFSIKLEVNHLFRKPIPATWEALKTGAPALLSAISGSFPALFFQKFMGSACETAEIFNQMMALYNAFVRILQILIALFLAITSGFLPAASYAWSSGNMKTLLWLIIHCTWLVVSIAVLWEIAMFGFPSYIGPLFSSNELFLARWKVCLIPVWLPMFINCLQYVVTGILEAIHWQKLAFGMTFLTQIAMWPTMSCILHFVNPEDEVLMFYSCMLNDLFSGLGSTPFAAYAIYTIVKRMKGGDRLPDSPLDDIRQPLGTQGMAE